MKELALRELQRRAQQTIVFERLPLYPKQAAIIDDPHRFTICEATTKAGKTMSHIEWILEEAINKKAGNWWWVATTSDTSDIAFRRSQARLRGWIDTGGVMKQVADPIPFEKNETRKYIDVMGARIWFKSAEKPDNLFGEDVYGAVGDEVTRWREEAWNALYTTLTATSGRAKLIGNVKGRRNWAYFKARQAQKENEEGIEGDWGYHLLTAFDAIEGNVIKSDIVEQARRDLPEAVFRELYLAEAGDDEGNPFGLNAIRACTITEPSTDETAAYGIDLAKSRDYTWVVGFDAEGHQTESHRWQSDWGTTKSRILALVGLKPTLIDSTGVGDPIVEELSAVRRNIQGFKLTSASKQQLMEGLAADIQGRQIRFFDTKLIAELESFEYEYTRTGVRYTAPPGFHDDGVIAVSLCALIIRRRHRTQFIDLPPIGWGAKPISTTPQVFDHLN